MKAAARILLFALFLFPFAAVPAEAGRIDTDTSMTYLFDYVFPDDVDPIVYKDRPGGDTPWLTAEFTKIDDKKISLILEAPGLVDGDLTIDGKTEDVQEFVTNWYFNFDPGLDIGDLTLLPIVDPNNDNDVQPSTIYKEQNTPENTYGGVYKADGDGYFDIVIEYPNSGTNRFIAGKRSEFEITYNGTENLSIHSFDLLSVKSTDHGPYLAAAHIQGLHSKTLEGSTWVSLTDQPIPEPGTLALVGFGFLGLAALLRKNRAGKD